MKYLLLVLPVLFFGCADTEVTEVKKDSTVEVIKEKVAEKRKKELKLAKELKEARDEKNALIEAEKSKIEVAAVNEKEIVEKKDKSKPESTIKEKTKIVAKKIKKGNSKKKAKKKKVKKKKSSAIMTFESKEFDYGRIKPGDIVKHNFKFKNTGKSDLVVSNAIASCGCTTPSFPFIPIAPGDEGYIGVVFDSSGKLGKQRPSITLTTNIGTKKIYLTGYVYDKLEK